jgi:hypothetical protein
MHRRHFIRYVALAVLLAIGSVGAAVATTSLAASPASALCATPREQGVWRNIDPNTTAITRTDVSLRDCGDQVLCDTDGNCTGGQTTFNLHLWGRCHPTDCDWGTTIGYPQYDGWIAGTYNFGFKISHVWVRAYDYWGLTYLRVWVYNDFTDGRADYVTDEWFLR